MNEYEWIWFIEKEKPWSRHLRMPASQEIVEEALGDGTESPQGAGQKSGISGGHWLQL